MFCKNYNFFIYLKSIIIKIEIVEFDNEFFFSKFSFNENNNIENIKNSLFH